MGIYLNPGNESFADLVKSETFIDKTGLIAYMNECIGKDKHLSASSRPRRFGKTIAVRMLTAYYSKGCDSKDIFSELEIGKDKSFEKHLNKYDVIRLDIQWIRTSAMPEIRSCKMIILTSFVEFSREVPQMNF